MNTIIAFFTNLWGKTRKTIYWILAILCVLSMAFIAGKCSTKQERINQNNNIIALNSEIQSNYVTIDGLKNSVQEKQAIILSQDMAIKSGLVREDLLKKLHIKDLVTNTELSGVIHKQDSMLKLPGKPIFITVNDTSGLSHDYFRIPFTLLDINEKYLNLSAGLKIDRSAWFNLSIPFTGTVTVGYKRESILKPLKPIGVFTTDNPYVKINEMQTVIVNEPKGILTKWWVHALVGGLIVEGVNLYYKK